MRLLRQVVVTLAGVALCVLGGVLLVLPGPGLLLIVAGLVLLSTEYAWARRLLGPARAQAIKGAKVSVSSPLHIAGSGVTGLALIGAGIAWIVASDVVPLGGATTGGSLIASGVIVLGLIGYSYRTYRDG